MKSGSTVIAVRINVIYKYFITEIFIQLTVQFFGIDDASTSSFRYSMMMAYRIKAIVNFKNGSKIRRIERWMNFEIKCRYFDKFLVFDNRWYIAINSIKTMNSTNSILFQVLQKTYIWLNEWIYNVEEEYIYIYKKRNYFYILWKNWWYTIVITNNDLCDE